MIRKTQTLTLSAPAALLHWLPGPAGGADSDRLARLSPESCSVRPAVPAPPPSVGLSAVQQPAGSASALAFQRGVQVCSGQPRRSLSINGLTLTSYYKEEMCKCSKIWLLRSVSVLQILCDAVRLWSEAATSLSYKPTHSETCRAHSNSYAAQVTEHQRAPNLHFTQASSVKEAGFGVLGMICWKFLDYYLSQTSYCYCRQRDGDICLACKDCSNDVHS